MKFLLLESSFDYITCPISVTVTLCVLSRDTICDLGSAPELANYGEYSGAPSEQQTYDYAKTILSLMCKEFHPEGRPNQVSNKLK